MPPTKPPTIGPTGVEFLVAMGRVDDVEVGEDVEVEECTPFEAPTPELDPPGMERMWK